MTRCAVFYRKFKELLESENLEALEDLCKNEASKLFRVKKYVQFCDGYMPDVSYGAVPETALRPLIQEGDPDIVVKVVERLKPLLVPEKRRKKPRVTSEVVKKTLAEVKGELYLTPTERKEIGSETRLKQIEAACDEFLAFETSERDAFLNDLKRIVDLLGTWRARLGPSCRAKIDEVREQVETLRNEFLLFLPQEIGQWTSKPGPFPRD